MKYWTAVIIKSFCIWTNFRTQPWALLVSRLWSECFGQETNGDMWPFHLPHAPIHLWVSLSYTYIKVVYKAVDECSGQLQLQRVFSIHIPAPVTTCGFSSLKLVDFLYQETRMMMTTMMQMTKCSHQCWQEEKRVDRRVRSRARWTMGTLRWWWAKRASYIWH